MDDLDRATLEWTNAPDSNAAVDAVLRIAREMRERGEESLRCEAEYRRLDDYAAREEAGHRHTEQAEDVEPIIGGDHATHTTERGLR